MALMQLTVIPLGTGSPSVGDYVAEIQKSLAAKGVSFKLTDMGTVLEGEAGNLLAVLGEIYELPFNKGAQRVVTQIVIDDRRDKKVAIGDKVDAVKARLSK